MKTRCDTDKHRYNLIYEDVGGTYYKSKQGILHLTIPKNTEEINLTCMTLSTPLFLQGEIWCVTGNIFFRYHCFREE